MVSPSPFPLPQWLLPPSLPQWFLLPPLSHFHNVFLPPLVSLPKWFLPPPSLPEWFLLPPLSHSHNGFSLPSSHFHSGFISPRLNSTMVSPSTFPFPQWFLPPLIPLPQCFLPSLVPLSQWFLPPPSFFHNGFPSPFLLPQRFIPPPFPLPTLIFLHCHTSPPPQTSAVVSSNLIFPHWSPSPRLYSCAANFLALLNLLKGKSRP